MGSACLQRTEHSPRHLGPQGCLLPLFSLPSLGGRDRGWELQPLGSLLFSGLPPLQTPPLPPHPHPSFLLHLHLSTCRRPLSGQPHLSLDLLGVRGELLSPGAPFSTGRPPPPRPSRPAPYEMSKARALGHEVAIQVELWGWSCPDEASGPLPAPQYPELRAFLRLLGEMTEGGGRGGAGGG